MVWIWGMSRENDSWGADFYGCDPAASYKNLTQYADVPVEKETRGIFKSSSGLGKFKALHAPPMSTCCVVDEVWKDIILKFVPTNRVQFLPTRLTARGKITEDFLMMLPFDRVVAIDKAKSEIRNMIENERGTFIFDVKKFVLKPNCLDGLHLARDKQMISLMLVSDELKNALASTGQDSVFYTEDEYSNR